MAPAEVITNVPGESAVEIPPKSVHNDKSDATLLEVFTDGVPSDSLDVPLVCEDAIDDNTKCEQCGFHSKSSHELKVHIRTQHRISQIDGAAEIVEEGKS